MTATKLLRAVTLIILLAGAVTFIVGESADIDRPDPKSLEVAAAPPKSVSVGETFVVDLPRPGFLNELDGREIQEQLRDWAVLATLARVASTEEQLADASYQFPPARLSYLEEMYAFEYGPGRRAYVDDRVLFFHDKDDRDPSSTLGRLADRVMLETGSRPKTVEVYSVEDLRNDGTLQIVRKPDVSGDELFSAAYGYLEAKVTSAEELDQWLRNVDELVSATRVDRSWVMAGRRFASSAPTKNVALEDVAALFQAHAKLAELKRAAEARVRVVNEELEQERERRFKEAGYSFHEKYNQYQLQKAERVLAKIDKDLDLVAAEKLALLADQGVIAPEAPGFSLDPQWLPGGNKDQPRMLELLRRLERSPSAEVSRIAALASSLRTDDDASRSKASWAASELAEIVSRAPLDKQWLADELVPRLRDLDLALATAPKPKWHTGFLGYYELQDWLHKQESSSAKAIATVLDFYAADAEVQCARYDGPLAGTRVGMNLFYTDVLAKLWGALDYGRTAPVVEVPGLLVMPHIELPETYAEELRDLPSTRLWFGPRADGVSISQTDNGSTRYSFRQQFTRVYAAGSNPLRPGLEQSPAETSRRVLFWWDRHYLDLAAYEPEFQLQNQIMKWSVITGAMVEHDATLGLADVEVDHGNKFFDWARKRPELRYRGTMRPRRESPSGTECMDSLHSYLFTSAGGRHVIEGGVSLGSRKGLSSIASLDASAPLARRFKNVGGSLGEGAAGTASRARPVLDGATVAIENAGKACARFAAGDLGGLQPTTRFARKSGSVAIELASNRGGIGKLAISTRDGRVSLKWSEGVVEQARTALHADPGVTTIAGRGEVSPIVLEDGSTIIPKLGDAPAIEVTKGRAQDALVSTVDADPLRGLMGSDTPAKWRSARAVDDAALSARLETFEWLELHANNRAEVVGSIERRFGDAAPEDVARSVKLKGIEGAPDGIDVRITKDGRVFVPRPEGTAKAAWRSLPERLDLTPSRLDEIARSSGEIDVAKLRRQAALESHAPVSARVELAAASEPKQLLQSSHAHAREVGDLLATEGRLEDAAHAFGELVSETPKTAEDMVRRALADLGKGHAEKSRAMLAKLAATGETPSATTRELLTGLAKHGESDVAQFVTAQLEKQPIDNAALSVNRGRVVVEYRAPGRIANATETPLMRQIPEPRRLKYAIDSGTPVYIDDRLLVGREGLEADLGDLVAAWSRKEGIKVRHVQDDALGMRPGLIREEGHTYTRARSAEEANGTSKFRAGAAVGAAVIVTSCALSDDCGN